MKKIYGTLAMVLVIVFHLAARFILEDAYTFSASSFNQTQLQTKASHKDLPVQLTHNATLAGAPAAIRNNSSFILSDPFADQWNP